MAKRFTDTGLYDKAWFRKLSPSLKCLWEYVLKKCDHAGVIDLDFDLASFQIGTEVNLADLEKFGGRVKEIEPGKFFISRFIDFQYGKLNKNNRAHASVIKILEKYNLINEGGELQNKGLVSPFQGDKDKDKDKDKVKDKDKEKESKPLDVKVTPDQIAELYVEILNGEGKLECTDFFFAPTSIENFKTITGFKQFQSIEQWAQYFQKVKESDWLTGRNGKGGCATLAWLLVPDNAAKVLQGQYKNNTKKKKGKRDFSHLRRDAS